MKKRNLKSRKKLLPSGMRIKAALFSLFCGLVLTQAGCNNTVSTNSGTTSSTATGTNPTLGGGVLPSGTALTPITIINVSPSTSSSDSMALDILGRDDEIGRYCPTATSCQCRFEWTVPGTSNTTDAQTTVSYTETNMLRCRYDLVPRDVTQFRVSVVVLAGGMQSNKITMNMPTIPSGQSTTNANNFLKVYRYQCKDVLTSNSRFYGNNTDFQDPQVWQMSMSFNFYTASLGEDYGGAVSNFECPMSPTDERNVLYQQDRYWPDLLPTTTAGPNGMDARCGVRGVAASCDCPGGLPTSGTSASNFDGQGTSSGAPCTTLFTPSVEYNSRSKIFGVTSGSSGTRVNTNGTTDDEPYDMALYSTRPLAGYDNVIFPTNLDEGSRSTLGVNNEKSKSQRDWSLQTTFNFECTDGTDPDSCKCITGLEKECRRYAVNRHDFYVSSFYDSTFRAPFCAPHTAGGANAQNSIRLLQSGGLDCSVDTSQTPPVRGKDVLGYAAYPNSDGSCPAAALPTKKKWALLWRFRAQLPKRALIDITNSNEIGMLMCTSPDAECTDDQTNSWDINNTDADIITHHTSNTANGTAGGDPAGRIGKGPKYCRVAGGKNEQFKTGIFGLPDQGPGQRFGNCLQIPPNPPTDSTDTAGSLMPTLTGSLGWGQTSGITIGQCQWADGFGPYALTASTDHSGAPVTGVGGSFRLFTHEITTDAEYALNPQPPALNFAAPSGNAATSGCYDPAQLYFQPTFCSSSSGTLSSCSGYKNILDGSWGCASRPSATVDEKRKGYALSSITTFATFDWQGFPFIAGDYTTLPSGAQETKRGVGSGGNFCNPTLPGSRWSSEGDSGYSWNQIPTAQKYPGYNDGKDVWLVGGSAQKLACIEADTDKNFGFLYNVHATRDPSDPYEATHLKPNGYVNRLPGSTATTAGLGFPGLVGAYPKTIKNWFDFVGIGCLGKCDNSSMADAYPRFPWVAGLFNGRGKVGSDTPTTPVPDAAMRSGPHSSTDSWGGYGIFQFATADLEQAGMSDVLYVASPTGLTLSNMTSNDTLLDQFRPVRYINGYKVEYNLDVDSQSSLTPSLRLPQFPICVLQDSEG